MTDERPNATARTEAAMRPDGIIQVIVGAICAFVLVKFLTYENLQRIKWCLEHKWHYVLLAPAVATIILLYVLIEYWRLAYHGGIESSRGYPRRHNLGRALDTMALVAALLALHTFDHALVHLPPREGIAPRQLADNEDYHGYHRRYTSGSSTERASSDVMAAGGGEGERSLPLGREEDFAAPMAVSALAAMACLLIAAARFWFTFSLRLASTVILFDCVGAAFSFILACLYYWNHSGSAFYVLCASIPVLIAYIIAGPIQKWKARIRSGGEPSVQVTGDGPVGPESESHVPELGGAKDATPDLVTIIVER